MKLKKQSDGHFYLHNEDGKPLICPHQDAGTEIRIEPAKLQTQQPKQFIDKRHMPCGSWCALFSFFPSGKRQNHFKVCQLCSDRSGFEATLEQ